MKAYIKVVALLSFLFLLFFSAEAGAKKTDWKTQVKELAKDGAVLVTDPQGKELLSLRPDKKLVPASTLKLVTSAAALDYLGGDFRFSTEFRVSKDHDLYIIGKGDPFLVSEELEFIANHLKSVGLTGVRDIYLDNSYFEPNMVLDGTNRSLNPYDAYNGALCVNFNTIYAKISKTGKKVKIESAEPQTPLTDMAKDLALKSRKRGKVRFNLADHPETCLLYAGELFKTFFQKAGITVSGAIKINTQKKITAPLYYKHLSRKNLSELIVELLEYSNNFMTNQVFLTLGAERYGSPATPEKGRRAVDAYLKSRGIPSFHVEEGSGLSRKTNVSARQMTAVLQDLRPNRDLLPKEGRVYYKTGTLSDVKSLAGYIEREKGGPLRFVILLNGAGIRWDTREKILDLLEENL